MLIPELSKSTDADPPSLNPTLPTSALSSPSTQILETSLTGPLNIFRYVIEIDDIGHFAFWTFMRKATPILKSLHSGLLQEGYI